MVISYIIATTKEIVSDIDFLIDYYTQHKLENWINNLNDLKDEAINTAKRICDYIVKKHRYYLKADTCAKYNQFTRMINITQNNSIYMQS